MDKISMKSHFLGLSRRAVIATFALALTVSSTSASTDAEQALETTIQDLENGLDARIGVFVRDPASDWEFGHRADERFLMASTFKSLLCGAVLAEKDEGNLSLDETFPIQESDILSYAPVAQSHIGQSLSISELCLATLDMSDNTAANLLIDRLGGPAEVTAYLRDIGDEVTRLDRMEPQLNTFAAGDPRDTTSPSAMASTWETLLINDALSPTSRAQLAEWMSYGGVTGALLRVSTPNDWTVIDKSGGGRDHTRNLVAMVTPPDGSPYLVAIFVSDTPADWDTRNAAVSEIGAAVVDVIQSQ